MFGRFSVSVAAALLALPFLALVPALQPAAAATGEQKLFVGLDLSGGIASGSSSTRDGGGVLPLFSGDGEVGNVHFDHTIGIGAHAGYRFNPSWSTFLRYRHVHGSVGFDAFYPSFRVASKFKGSANSDAVLGGLIHHHSLSPADSLQLSAGAGLAFNRLYDIVERDRDSGLFVADVASHSRTAFTADIGLGLQHAVAAGTTIGLDLSATYAGGFATGNSRRGNLGVTVINPYGIDNVWRGNLGLSLRQTF